MAAAIASGLARGLAVPDAVALGKRYIVEAVRNAYPLGVGPRPGVSPVGGAAVVGRHYRRPDPGCGRRWRRAN